MREGPGRGIAATAATAVAVVALIGSTGAPASAKPSPQATLKRLEAEAAKLKQQLAAAKAQIAQLEKSQPSSPLTAPTTVAPPSISKAPPVTTAAQAASGQSPFTVGNAHPSYPKGDPGKVSVVYTGPVLKQPTGALTVFVVRNNTSKPVSKVSVTQTIKSSSGATATGQSILTTPGVIEPGEWAYGADVYQTNVTIGAADQVSYKIQTSGATTSHGDSANVKLSLPAASSTATVLQGTLANTNGKTIGSPAVAYYCLDPSGHPTTVVLGGVASQANLKAGAQEPYTLDLSTSGVAKACASYLVAGYAPYA